MKVPSEWLDEEKKLLKGRGRELANQRYRHAVGSIRASSWLFMISAGRGGFIPSAISDSGPGNSFPSFQGLRCVVFLQSGKY